MGPGPRDDEDAVLECRDVSELATGYMERDLPLRTWIGVRFHLFLCSMCRAYVDQLAKTQKLLRGRSLPPPAADVEATLVAEAESRGRGGD